MHDLVVERVGVDVARAVANSGESEGGVDVQVGLSTARRELGLAIGDGVGEEIILGHWADEGGLSRPLGGFTGEEVDSLLDSSDTAVEGSVSTVIGLVDGVRPSLEL